MDKSAELQAAIDALKERQKVVTIEDHRPTSVENIANKMTPTLQTLKQNFSIEPWQCPDCGQDVPAATVEDHRGETYYYPRRFCPCPDGQAKQAAHEREIAMDEYSDRAGRLLEEGGLNRGKYGRFLLRTWDADRAGSNAAETLAKINDYIDHVKDGGARQWAYLYGPYGNGKTHLAVAALRQISLNHLWRPHIIVWPELCQATQESWSSDNGPTEGAMWGKARSVRILLIDDLDKTATSEWAMSKLFALINYRAVNESPTIITGNKALSVLKAEWERSGQPHVQDTGLAVLSRIADELWGGIRFSGKDQRWVR